MPPTEEFDSALCNQSNRAADGSAPESLPVQDSPNHDVGKVLQSLPEEFKTALLLVGVNELSYEDAARATKVPIGTVRWGLSRARATMRYAYNVDSQPARRGVVSGLEMSAGC